MPPRSTDEPPRSSSGEPVGDRLDPRRTKVTSRKRPVSDTRRSIQALRRFEPTGPRQLLVNGIGSFLVGMSEAAVLALISVAAVSATGDQTAGKLVFLDLSPGRAVAVAAIILIVNVALSLTVAYRNSRLVAQASLSARTQLLDAYFSSSYEEKTGGRIAFIQDRLTTYVDRFQQSFVHLISFISAGLSVVAYAVGAMIIDPLTLLALALVGLLVVAVQRPFVKRTKQASRALRDVRSGYAANVTESVLLARELAVFGTEGTAANELHDTDRVVAEHFRQTRFLQQTNGRIYQGLALGFVLLGLAFVVGGENRELVSLAAVALILLRSLSYGQNMLSSMQQLADHGPFVEDLTDLIDQYRSRTRAPGTVQIDRLETISFDEVGFAYEDHPVLADVSFTIGANETIGIVGPSGAGKTTIANLLLRLYEPGTGRITVNGTDVADITDSSWHRLTAIVPQEPRLLMGTVADNIRFHRDLSDERLQKAAEAANIAEFIRGLPEGFEAPVGELGSNLSGGQRQRVCIARALAGDPQILVLDEPTSALDGESEAAIQRTLTALRGEVAMIIVAHRLSTLSICDRIAIVDRGRLIDFGTHEELRDRSAYFRDALAQAGL